MPVVDIKLNALLPEATLRVLAAECSAALASSFEKSCPSVLVSINHGPLFVDGSTAPAAWVVVRSAIELSIETKRLLCQRFSEILTVHCALEPERVFLLLSLVPPEDAWSLTPTGPICVTERRSFEKLATMQPTQAATV